MENNPILDSEQIEDALNRVPTLWKGKTSIDTDVLRVLIKAAAQYMSILIDVEIEQDSAAYKRGEGPNYTWDEVVAHCLNKADV